MPEEKPAPRRNVGALFLVAAGGLVLLSTLANGIGRAIPDFPTNLFGTISALLFASFLLVPVAIVIAFIYFGIGGRDVAALGGPTVRARLLFLVTGFIALAAQYSLAGPAFVAVGDSSAAQMTTIVVLDALAVVAAILTSVAVFRARVVQGLARWALPTAIVLTIASAVFPFVRESNWWDIPHGVGILILGIAYWRAGVPGAVPVPALAESLAE